MILFLQYDNAIVFSDDIKICFNATIDKDKKLPTGSRLVHATVLMDLLWNRATFGDGSYPTVTDQSHNLDTLMDEFNFYVPGRFLNFSNPDFFFAENVHIWILCEIFIFPYSHRLQRAAEHSTLSSHSATGRRRTEYYKSCASAIWRMAIGTNCSGAHSEPRQIIYFVLLYILLLGAIISPKISFLSGIINPTWSEFHSVMNFFTSMTSA